MKKVSPEDGFARVALEDFVNQGKRHVTHMPCDRKKKDWIDFVNR